MKQRFSEITLMNAILCICVVMIHLTSPLMWQWTLGSVPHIFAFIINKGLNFAVPAFIFLSGFKLYNKYGNSKVDIKKYAVGRLKGVVIPYITAVLVYFVYMYVQKAAEVWLLPEYIFLGTGASHFYYIIIAVQAYIIFPLLNKVINKNSYAVLGISLIISGVFCMLTSLPYSDRFIGTYIFYFVFGMFYAKHKAYDKVDKYFPAVLLCFAVITFIYLRFTYNVISGQAIPYIELIKMAYVTVAMPALYGLCSALKKSKAVMKISGVISSASYDIYLYHCLLLTAVQTYVLPRIIVSPLQQFLLSAAILYTAIALYSIVKGGRKA